MRGRSWSGLTRMRRFGEGRRGLGVGGDARGKTGLLDVALGGISRPSQRAGDYIVYDRLCFETVCGGRLRRGRGIDGRKRFSPSIALPLCQTGMHAQQGHGDQDTVGVPGKAFRCGICFGTGVQRAGKSPFGGRAASAVCVWTCCFFLGLLHRYVYSLIARIGRGTGALFLGKGNRFHQTTL